MAMPQTPNGTAAPVLRFDGALPPLPFRDGRRAIAEGQFRFGARPDVISGWQAQAKMGWPGDGWLASAAIRPRRFGELRRIAHGQSAGEPQLHRLRRNAGLLHPAMWDQNRPDLEDIRR